MQRRKYDAQQELKTSRQVQEFMAAVAEYSKEDLETLPASTKLPHILARSKRYFAT